MSLEAMNSTESVVDQDWVFKYGDPRVESYPWMDSPYKTYASIVIFLVFVKIIGPRMMKNRQPYNLRSVMLIYNIVLVALSAWMFYRFAAYGWLSKYSWRCEPIDFSNDDAAIKVVEAYYVYYVSKFIEFLDTFFFVLRKKNSQISFLHVFHHALMPIATWYFVKYGAGGYATIVPFTNTFAHVMMYSYYLLSSLGPSVQKYIWWKRHITNIQMIQFVLITAESLLVIVTRPEHCDVRYSTAGLSLFIGVIFMVLFTPFYFEQYIRKKKRNAS